MGLSVDLTGSFFASLLLFASIMVAGAIAALFATPPRRGAESYSARG